MVFIQAEDGQEFQEYVDGDGKRIPSGKTIGVETTDIKGKVTLHLFKGIYFSSN